MIVFALSLKFVILRSSFATGCLGAMLVPSRMGKFPRVWRRWTASSTACSSAIRSSVLHQCVDQPHLPQIRLLYRTHQKMPPENARKYIKVLKQPGITPMCTRRNRPRSPTASPCRFPTGPRGLRAEGSWTPSL